MLHWFTGSPAQARRAVEMGCWFSVNQPMVATATGRALVETLPKDRVVTETDGPFNHRSGAQAQPWDVATTVKRLATVWAMPLQEADALVDSNFRNLVSQSQT